MKDENIEDLAIVYWCGGAGHAARSIPVAKEAGSRGIDVSIGGGGPGSRFVDMNGFEQPDFTVAADPAEFTALDFIPRVIKDLIPTTVRRTLDIHRWLKDEDPEKLITDDLFAAISASIQGIEFYRIDHLTPNLLPTRWKIPLQIYNNSSLIFGDQIMVTSLWKDEEDPKGITRVGPLAQEGEEDQVEDYDVLINPGSWGKNFDEIRNRLEEKGFYVRTVGDENWETKKSMTPYTKAADVVICTGFSSIADTVVAGTPCIIYPFLPFQKAIADRVEEKQLEGLQKAESVKEAVEAAVYYCNGEGGVPEYENGAPELIDYVLD